MRKPHKTTIKALKERKTGSLPALARELGLSYSMRGALSDILNNQSGKVSIETENEVRESLGLQKLTQSGNHVSRPRKLTRPIVTSEQESRRLRLGLSWYQMIEMGLDHLENNPPLPDEEEMKMIENHVRLDLY